MISSMEQRTLDRLSIDCGCLCGKLSIFMNLSIEEIGDSLLLTIVAEKCSVYFGYFTCFRVLHPVLIASFEVSKNTRTSAVQLSINDPPAFARICEICKRCKKPSTLRFLRTFSKTIQSAFLSLEFHTRQISKPRLHGDNFLSAGDLKKSQFSVSINTRDILYNHISRFSSISILNISQK